MAIPQISDVNRFVEAHTLGSAVAFIDSRDPSSPDIIKQLDALSDSTPSGFGFAIVDAAATENQELCKQQDVCLFPVVKFYRPDGEATDDCWVGTGQIIENASRSSFNQDWLKG